MNFEGSIASSWFNSTGTPDSAQPPVNKGGISPTVVDVTAQPNDWLAATFPISVVTFFLLVWMYLTSRTVASMTRLCGKFQSDYQQGDVKKIYYSYSQSWSNINDARRRRQRTSTESAASVLRIERYSRLLVWLAKRAEYYEDLFQVKYREHLHNDALNNSLFFLFASMLGGLALLVLNAFVLDGSRFWFLAYQVSIFWYSLFWLAAYFFIVYFIFPRFDAQTVGSPQQLADWLEIKNWTRSSKFALHDEVAKVVGKQIQEIHHAEDQRSVP
jgi:hypothetical protein